MQSLNALLGGTVIPKQQLITEDTIWHRPEKMVGTTVWLTMIGGGQSGLQQSNWSMGGNSGEYVVDWPVDIGSTTQVACVVGAGGVPPNHARASGQPSSFGTFLSVTGGGDTVANRALGERRGSPYDLTQHYPAGEASPGSAGRGSSARAVGAGGLLIGPNPPVAAEPTASRGYGAGGGGTIGDPSGPYHNKPGLDGCILVKWLEYI